MEKKRLPPRLGLYYPCPVLLVSCQAQGKKPNIITVAAGSVMSAEPPLVGIGISPERYSHKLITEAGEWVINIPFAHQAELADFCGHVSGRHVDKFAERDLQAVPSEVIATPRIAECPVNMECVCQDILHLGSHDWFVGEIVAVHVAKTIYTESGKLNVARAAPMVWTDGGYWNLGKSIGPRGMSQ